MVAQSVAIRVCDERDLDHFGAFGAPSHVDYCREQFGRGRDAVTILVAVDDGDLPIGKLHLDFVTRASHREAVLVAAAVKLKLQSRGIGTALMGAAEELVCERGFHGIVLGVVRDVQVEDGRVHVEFTPTFLGCPALEVMRAQMAAKIAELGAEPDVEVVQDDSWSTDRITPAGREKLRAAGFAPPAPRGAGKPTLVQLESNAFRCPYCGSSDTALENIFGPTPCRSLRYCRSCKQPFEQFKTI